MTTTFGLSVSRIALLRLATALGATALGLSGAGAAEVTYERLVNPEPQNWLMNHHDYGSHRFSALDAINKGNVKNLKLAFAVALGGTTGNEIHRGDAAGRRRLHVHARRLGRGLQDRRALRHAPAASSGRWTPAPQKPDRNRGVALWGNLVISVTGFDGRVIATDKETGKVVWDKNLLDQPDLEHHRGAAGARRTRSSSAPPAATAACATGSPRSIPRPARSSGRPFVIPAPGEPGSETWKDKNNAWQTGGGAFYVTGSYDPATNLTYWGAGNPVPRIRFRLAARRQSLHRLERSRSTPRPARSSGTSSIHAERHPGLRRDRHAHHHRRQGQRRGPQDRGACRPQRLQLHVRPPQRPVPQGGAICREGELDQGHRSQDRQAGRLRSRQGRADLRSRLEAR